MKRPLSFFVALFFATTALWAYDFQSGDIYYNITSSTKPYTAEVTYQEEYSSDNYKGLTSATLPVTVTYNDTTYSVTSIGKNAFSNCTSLTSVTIPKSVTSIGMYAFDDCSGLTSIVVERGNTVYDSRENCNALIHTATNTLIRGCQTTTIPNSVTSIGEGAFWGCTGLISITIPNSVTSIGISAFSNCTGLTSITIPNGITDIPRYVFYGCTGLTSVTIPKNIKGIAEFAFYGCSGLASICFLGTTPPTLALDPFDGVPTDSLTVYIPCGTTSAYQLEFQHQLHGFTNYVEKLMYTLSVTSEDEAMGTAQIIKEASSCTDNTAIVEATPIDHYHFTQWSDGNTDNPRRVAIENDTTFTAVFAIDRHKVTTTCDIRHGIVTGAGTFDYGTQIVLTAVPNSGYEFRQWSNGLTYNPYRFTVLEDRTLRAEFVPATAIDNTPADVDTTTPQKVLIDGQVYILRNGKTYTTTGVEVK